MNLKFYHEIDALCSKGNIKLVAVSKTKPISSIETLYKEGQRIFGENKVQELNEKQKQLPKDIEWHFIGHLQKNKVKYIAPYVSLIHAVDNIALLKEIDKRAMLNNRKINCLVQFHIAEEDSKFGLKKDEISNFFEQSALLKNVAIIGLMGMATFTDDETKISAEFKFLKNIFEDIKMKHFFQNANFKEISMGMSGDYKLAITEGSTMIRIGSSIFGVR